MASYINIVLVVHVFIAIAMIGVVLLQRSEGGALGIGGGGGGGLMSARGTANALTRATTVLAALFFTTSILLTILARAGAPTALEIEAPGAVGEDAGESQSDLPALPSLPGGFAPTPTAPTSGGAETAPTGDETGNSGTIEGGEPAAGGAPDSSANDTPPAPPTTP